MPGFDGTGPRGQGAMTGGGFGRCSGAVASYGSGLGRGFGRGMNRGHGRCGFAGRGSLNWGGPVAAPDEKTFLESRLQWLEQETAAVQDRLNGIQK